MFVPKLVTILRAGYTRKQFWADAGAGVVVGIVALPLAIAFAIASGVSPERGLYTAIVAGFLVSALGGSRVQIGGPTGAFVVIVAAIVAEHGVDGLIVATLMGGLIMLGMGLARLGTVIKFIPYPIVTGFTAGIGLIIKHWSDIFDAMPGPVQTAMNFVASIVSKTVNFIIGALNKLTSKLNAIKNFGGNLNPFSHTPDIPEIPGVGDFQQFGGFGGHNMASDMADFAAANDPAAWERLAAVAVAATDGVQGLGGGIGELDGAVDGLARSASAAAEQALSAAEGLQAVADAFAQWQLRQLREAFLRSGLSEDEFKRRLQSPEAKFYAELLRSRERDIFSKLLVGSFAHGGVVPRDGLAAVHAGEKITRASEAGAGGVVYLTVNASGEQSEASAERITRRVMRALSDELGFRSMSGPRLPQSGYTPL
jgi:hypothetical protein